MFPKRAALRKERHFRSTKERGEGVSLDFFFRRKKAMIGPFLPLLPPPGSGSTGAERGEWEDSLREGRCLGRGEGNDPLESKVYLPIVFSCEALSA